MSLDKLKDTARKHEQKREWKKAVEVYQQAIKQIEAGKDDADLSLFNRVGDLLKDQLGDLPGAVKHYERAVELYTDQGLFTNAIALCGKILRTQPDRIQTYLTLAKLNGRKGVLVEAKRNLLEYLGRMDSAGQRDEAIKEARAFAEKFGQSADIRSMVSELLRAAGSSDNGHEAPAARTGAPPAEPPRAPVETSQHRSISATQEQRARSGLVFIDPDADEPPAASPAPAAPPAAPAPARPAPTTEQPAVSPLSAEIPSLDALLAPDDNPADGTDLPPVAMLDGLESNSFDANAHPADAGSLDGLIIDSPFEGASLDISDDLGIERTSEDGGFASMPGSDESPGSGLDDIPLLEVGEEVPPGPLDEMLLPAADDFRVQPTTEAPAAIDLPMLDVGDMGGGTPAGPPGPDLLMLDVDALEERILDDPANPAVHAALAEKLEGAGDPARAAEEFAIARDAYAEQEGWAIATDMAERAIRLAPDEIGHHVRRLELLSRVGASRAMLAAACQELGHAHVRRGEEEAAQVAFARASALDPTVATGTAATAEAPAMMPELEVDLPPAPEAPLSGLPLIGEEDLAFIEPEPPPAAPAPPAAAPVPPASPSSPAPVASAPPPAPRAAPPAPQEPASAAAGDDFVDLGSMIFDDDGPRDTRMRLEGVAEGEPDQRDEQGLFAEMLNAFKRGVDANIDSDDFQAHYDLGVAYREMGLLEEAISEFQKALRAPEGRLRTSEALGGSFFDMGKYAIAESVLRRAVDQLPGADEEKIGLLYWLGRALEAQARMTEARGCYERALAVDIKFMDVSERIHRLTHS